MTTETRAQHTPEPWLASGALRSDGAWVISAEPGYAIDQIAVVQTDDRIGSTDANAARIVACVNACAGIDPEAVPALLAAARTVQRCSVAEYNDAGYRTGGRIIPELHFKALVAAIAKARP